MHMMRAPLPWQPDVGSPEDWERLEKALGFSGHDPARRNMLWRQLLAIACEFDDSLQGVRTSHLREVCAIVKSDAARLFFDLEAGALLDHQPTGKFGFNNQLFDIGVPPTFNPAILRALFHLRVHVYGEHGRDRVAPLLKHLAWLIKTITEAEWDLADDKGGRPNDRGNKTVIQRLAVFYQQQTSRKPSSSAKPSGPFFRFVRSFWDIFAEGDRAKASDAALAQIVRRSLLGESQANGGTKRHPNIP